MTQKPKGISAVNRARLENYTLICLEETKISLKTISQEKKSLLCCDTIDTFLKPPSLSDNHTAAESLFELTDNHRNPN